MRSLARTRISIHIYICFFIFIIIDICSYLFVFVFVFRICIFIRILIRIFIGIYIFIRINKKPPSNALGGKSLFYLISFFSLLVAKDARAVFVKALDSALRAAYAERIFADKA